MSTRPHKRLMEAIKKSSEKSSCTCDGGIPCADCQFKNRAYANAAYARFIEDKGTNPENY